MEYQNFNVEELALDPFFKQWVLDPTHETELFWLKWLLKHPDKKQVVEEARAIVLALDFEDDLQAFEVEEEWDKVYAKILNASSGEYAHADAFQEKPSWWRQHRGIAAVYIGLLLALGVTIAIILSQPHQHQYVSYATPYGETKQVDLPDGSVVTLNAASRITFSTDWDEHDAREIWIDGEAFFSVVHTENDQKFIVRTDKESSVEVLGTKFNVYDRHNNVKVVLQEGKVQVKAKKQSNPFVMAPGELVEWRKGEEKLQKKKVSTHLYTSWREHEILFERTALKEVAQTLEDIKGYRVIFKDPTLRELNFTGSFATDDADSFLVFIAKSFKIRVTRVGDRIEIDK